MYFRRHCYDKARRCPGWAGGGMRRPRDADEPRRWWQQRTRCNGGTLWACYALDDPWESWRWHRCTVCDVRALPIVVKYLDPTWWRHEIRWKVRGIIDLFRDHRRQWMYPAEAPWWSLPYAIWRELRSAYYERIWSWGGWWRELYEWHAPRHRAQRDARLAEIREHYGVS